MKKPVRAQISSDAIVDVTDPRPAMPPVSLLGSPVGNVIAHQGDFVFTGRGQFGAFISATVTVGRKSCECGAPTCNGAGIAFTSYMSAEEARNLASQLNSVAEELETTAREAAASAIAKARLR